MTAVVFPRACVRTSGLPIRASGALRPVPCSGKIAVYLHGHLIVPLWTVLARCPVDDSNTARSRKDIGPGGQQVERLLESGWKPGLSLL